MAGAKSSQGKKGCKKIGRQRDSAQNKRYKMEEHRSKNKSRKAKRHMDNILRQRRKASSKRERIAA